MERKEWNKIRKLRGHDGTVDSVGFSPSGEFIVSGIRSSTQILGSADSTIKLWNAKNGNEISNLQGQQ